MSPALVATDVVLALTLAVSIWTDLRHRLILDVVTGPAFVAGLVLQALRGGAGDDWLSPGLEGALAASLLALLLFGLFHLTGGLGAGDVKLVVAVGALVGMPAMIGALLAGTVAGGIQGALALAARTGPGRRLSRRVGMAGADAPEFGRTVPLGVGLSTGIGLFWAALRLGFFAG